MKAATDEACGLRLHRRGIAHCAVRRNAREEAFPVPDAIRARWQAAEPVHLPGMLLPDVERHAGPISEALELMCRVRRGESCADILLQEPYISRLEPDFDLLSPVHSGHDAQEIEKIAFDAVKSGELHAEDLWLKVSRLSFFDEDESIRFRFSYGMEMFKNQEDDPLREMLAAELAARVFPECGIVCDNERLRALLESVMGFAPAFVERIIYSNAPGGGAQFHQDVEVGHFGVVYAQLHGHTAWLALPRQALLAHVRAFLDADAGDMFAELRGIAREEARLAALLEAGDQGALEILLNATPDFTRRLLDAGHGLTLSPGDVLLLPQATTEHCCWHSVFCLEEAGSREAGHSLSFALCKPH